MLILISDAFDKSFLLCLIAFVIFVDRLLLKLRKIFLLNIRNGHYIADVLLFGEKIVVPETGYKLGISEAARRTRGAFEGVVGVCSRIFCVVS